MKKALNVAVYLMVLLCSVLFIYYGNQYLSHGSHGGIAYDREEELDTLVFAKIVSIDQVTERDTSGKEIAFTAKTFAFGSDRSEVIQGRQILNDNSGNMPAVSVGDKAVLLSYGGEYLFQYYYRLDKVIVLGLAIVAFILLMGGMKGVRTIVSLALTCLSIFLVFIPSIKAGYNIYVSTVIICLYIMIETLMIVYGLSKKSVIAAFSCAVGIAFSGSISLLMDRWMKLTGYINDDTYMLDTLFGVDVDVRALMFSMITIGALGAIMDVSMSVTSPLCELKETNKEISATALIKSGFHIGRDFMGTMTNTLILAYMGSSMIVVLIYAASNYPLLSILNKEAIIFEFLQSLIGCLGILFTIPFTTIVASLILSGGKERQRYQPKHVSRRYSR